MRSRARRTSLAGERGFSLAEMMVGLFIVGMSVLTLMPNLKNLASKNRVNDAARQVQSGLQLARMKAINEGQDYVLQFTSNGWNIYLDTNQNGYKDTSEKYLYAAPVKLPKSVTYSTPTFPNGYEVADQIPTTGCQCIRWQSNGTMRVTGSTTRLAASVGNGTEYRQLTASAAGSIKLQRWNNNRWE